MRTDVHFEVVDVGVPADLVAQLGPFMLNKTSAVATRPPTLEEFETAITWVKDVERASPFWFGDLLRLADGPFGEMASQGMDATVQH